MKLSNWLLTHDEEFLSILEDEYKRKASLKDLYRFRIVYLSWFLLSVIMAFVGIVFDKSGLIGIGLILLVVQSLGYLDADSRIRSIRLYELFVEKQQQSQPRH